MLPNKNILLTFRAMFRGFSQLCVGGKGQVPVLVWRLATSLQVVALREARATERSIALGLCAVVKTKAK